MEWNLSESKKETYTSLLKSAQEIEANIGSTQYRVHKFILLREDIDRNLKAWWDETIKELDLDPTNNYMVNKDGIVSCQNPKSSKPALTVADLK